MRTTFSRFSSLAGLFLLVAACDSSTDDVGADPSAGAAGAVAGTAGAGGSAAGQGGAGQAGQGEGGAGLAGQGTGGLNQAGQGTGGMSDAGKGGAGAGGQVPFEQAHSDKPRLDGTAVSEADRKAVVDGNNAFAFDLYGKLAGDPGNAGNNLFFSPISMTMALGMTSAGATGATQTEIDQALHFTLPQASLHPALNWLALELNKRPQQAIDYAKNHNGSNVPEVALNTVNALWGEKTLAWQAPFLDVMSQSYGAGVNLGDFKTNFEGERATINQWIADQTADRIKDLLPPKSLDETTRIVLVNAINLTFAWHDDFDPAKTATAPFTVEGGAPTTASLMNRQLQSFYAEDDLAESLVLPLFSKSLSVVLYVPRAGKFAEFESKVATELPALKAAEQYRDLLVSVPRFTFTTPSIKLSDILKDLGMKTPFTGAANFSPMTVSEPLYISEVFHKAMLGFDEIGVQAAAATAVVGDAGGIPDEPKPVKVDRSFLVGIRDEGTGALLFFGRILDPGKS